MSQTTPRYRLQWKMSLSALVPNLIQMYFVKILLFDQNLTFTGSLGCILLWPWATWSWKDGWIDTLGIVYRKYVHPQFTQALITAMTQLYQFPTLKILYRNNCFITTAGVKTWSWIYVMYKGATGNYSLRLLKEQNFECIIFWPCIDFMTYISEVNIFTSYRSLEFALAHILWHSYQILCSIYCRDCF